MSLVLDDFLDAPVVVQPTQVPVQPEVVRSLANADAPAKVMKVNYKLPKRSYAIDESSVVDLTTKKAPVQQKSAAVKQKAPVVEEEVLEELVPEVPELSLEEQAYQLAVVENSSPELRKSRNDIIRRLERFKAHPRLSKKIGPNTIPPDFSLLPLASLELIYTDVKVDLSRDDDCSMLGIFANMLPSAIENGIESSGYSAPFIKHRGFAGRIEKNMGYQDAKDEIIIENSGDSYNNVYLRFVKHMGKELVTGTPPDYEKNDIAELENISRRYPILD